MGKSDKFLEGLKFPCFIESAKFYIDKEEHRKVRVDILITVVEEMRTYLPANISTVAKVMAADKAEKVVFADTWEERLIEIYAGKPKKGESEAKPSVTAEDVAIKKVRLECDVETGQVTLHFSFVGDDKAIGTWVHDNYGRDAFILVLAMQGELAGL
jgi:hypothetical protein